MTKMSATSGSIENATQFTFVPIEINQQTSTMSTLFTFAPIDSKTATESINSGIHSSSYYNATTTKDEKHEQKWDATTTTYSESSSMAINMNNESSLTSQKSGDHHGLTTIYENIYSGLDSTTLSSLENVITTPSLSENFTSDSMNLSTSTNVYETDNSQSNEDISGMEKSTSSMEIPKDNSEVSVPYLLTTESILINSTLINHNKDLESSSSNEDNSSSDSSAENPNIGIDTTTNINLQMNISTETAYNPLTSFDTDYLKDRNETAIYNHESNDIAQPSILNSNNQIINNTKIIKVNESNESNLNGTGSKEIDSNGSNLMELKDEDKPSGDLREDSHNLLYFQHMI